MKPGGCVAMTLVIVIFGYVVFKIAINSFTDYFLGSPPQRTKAVIINEKNFMGNQPVNPKFFYSYAFNVNGKQYKGNSHDTLLRISDTVKIEYNVRFPWINQSLNRKE